MKIKITVLIILHILPALSKSTGDPEIQIQCPSLPPNQHVSRLHCKMADGSLIHVFGPGPFDCEMSYVAVRPQTVKGNTNQDSEETSNEGSENCELLLIKFTDDGLVHHSCCEDGVAVFTPQEHQVPSPQPIDPIDEEQKPIQHLQKDDHIMEEKLQTESEEGLSEDDDYDDEDEEADEGEEDYEYEDDDTEEEGDEDEDEDGGEDYEDYGVDEDINDENSADSGAGQEPEAQQDNEFKDL